MIALRIILPVDLPVARYRVHFPVHRVQILERPVVDVSPFVCHEIGQIFNGRIVKVNEHETAPRVGMNPVQREIVLIEIARFDPIWCRQQLTIGRKRPRVIGANDSSMRKAAAEARA